MKAVRIKVITNRRVNGSVKRPLQPGKQPKIIRKPPEPEDDDD